MKRSNKDFINTDGMCTFDIVGLRILKMIPKFRLLRKVQTKYSLFKNMISEKSLIQLKNERQVLYIKLFETLKTKRRVILYI